MDAVQGHSGVRKRNQGNDSITKFLCLDTNIPLLDVNNIIELGSQPNTVIVLPETVLDELDSKKSGLGELAYQARSFGRLIARCGKPVRTLHDNMIVSKFVADGVHIWIVSIETYPLFKDVAPNVLNDRKIIEVAIQFAKFYEPVTFISNDVMCRIRADSLGLEVSDFKIVDKVDYEFTKCLEVSEGTFKTLHNRSILEVDPEHLAEHYNYKFSTPTSSQIKLASITNDTISILGKDSEQELRRQEVNPANADQLLLSRAIQDPTTDMVVCEALAGSGKTLVSLSNAIRLVKSNSPYSSIMYVRVSVNDVEAVEEVGFLPGTADEKNAVYYHPLYDSLDFIARNRTKGNKVKGRELDEKVEEQVEKIITDCNITASTGLGMRGRTFTDTVIIFDEIGNASKPSLQKMLTRVGKNCKVILIGSNNQIDNPNMTKFTNGLSVILNDCATTTEGINKHVVPLQRVVRSDFAEYAEKLFSKDI